MFPRIAGITKPEKSLAVECNRCGGSGRMEWYGHVDGGICFRCGGTGKDPKYRMFGYPTEWTVEQCADWLAEYERKAALRAEKRQTVAERKKAKVFAANAEAHAGFMDAVDYIQSQGDDTLVKSYLTDIINKAHHYYISDSQAEAVIAGAKWLADAIDRRAKDESDKRDVPTGNGITVEGAVKAVRLHESEYGSKWKMLVLGDGWKVWSSVPTSAFIDGDCSYLVETRISFVANVEQSHDDHSFGFAKRPRKFALCQK